MAAQMSLELAIGEVEADAQREQRPPGGAREAIVPGIGRYLERDPTFCFQDCVQRHRGGFSGLGLKQNHQVEGLCLSSLTTVE
jgi:hypothetical protein